MNDYIPTPDDIFQACNEIVNLVHCANKVATQSIGNGEALTESLVLIRSSMNRIGLLADHLTGYSLNGQAHWLSLPGADDEPDVVVEPVAAAQ